MADVGDAAAPTGLITLEDFLRRAHLASGREWPPPRHRPPPSPAHPPPAPPDTAYVLHCRTVPLASPPASPFFAIPLDGGGCVVADYGHDRLSVFCPRGSILRHIPCARPLGMALGDEAMHVAGADGLATLDLEGGVIRRVGGASESESGSASGDASAAASAPLLSRACGVAIDSAGAREPHHGLHRTPLALTSRRRTNTLPTPSLAGSIYVSDSARHRVAVFSPTGAFVRAFGSGPAGGFGELDDPRGIAVRDGGVAGGRICHVYVADMCNHRVQARAARVVAASAPRTVHPPPPHRSSPLTDRRALSSVGTATARANSNTRAASLSRAGCCSCPSTWAGE